MTPPPNGDASVRDWLKPVLRTLAVIGCLALLIKGGDLLGVLPAPAVGWDPELTVLEHQLRASQKPSGAEIVVVGDSTCLAGVDAVRLSGGLPARPEARSLALYVWLGMDVYAEVMSDYASSNPGKVRAVVLLVRRGKLTDENLEAQNEEIWRQARQPRQRGAALGQTGSDWLGARLLRRHILSHCLNTPLRGRGAAFFGFSSGIDAFMRTSNGSLPTFGTAVPGPPTNRKEASAPYVLTPVAEADSRFFREKLPAGARLFIGLTPCLLSTASPDERLKRFALLRQWGEVIQADAILTNLPPALPDIFFSPGEHLNEAGQTVFTTLLARELTPLMSQF